MKDTDAIVNRVGRTFITHGTRDTEASTVTAMEMIGTQALEPGTHAQRTELIHHSDSEGQTGKGKPVILYMDIHYAFGTTHVYGTMYRIKGSSLLRKGR